MDVIRHFDSFFVDLAGTETYLPPRVLGFFGEVFTCSGLQILPENVEAEAPSRARENRRSSNR